MTERIDHVAEARKVATRIENNSYADRQQYLTEAQLHATLALVEQARVANLIAVSASAARQVAEGTATLEDYLRVYDVLNPQIRAGLGLDDE